MHRVARPRDRRAPAFGLAMPPQRCPLGLLLLASRTAAVPPSVVRPQTHRIARPRGLGWHAPASRPTTPPQRYAFKAL
jgi:hypothetical protein